MLSGKNARRRCVITGLGPITCIGQGKENFWRGILAEQAEFHCRRALELDPTLPESHIARGYVLWSQAKNYAHREAIAEFEKSLALHPNVDGAHGHLGLIFSHAGRMKEGLAAFEKAHRVNPQNAWAQWAGLAHLWSGEYEAADRRCAGARCPLRCGCDCLKVLGRAGRRQMAIDSGGGAAAEVIDG